jgi:hypothetical protein
MDEDVSFAVVTQGNWWDSLESRFTTNLREQGPRSTIHDSVTIKAIVDAVSEGKTKTAPVAMGHGRRRSVSRFRPGQRIVEAPDSMLLELVG